MPAEPIANPHDRFFKQLMAQPDAASDFMRAFLPEDVVELMDLATLEQTAQSFVDEALRVHHSDLLFQVKLRSKAPAFVYVLFEHKSYVDPGVFVQLLGYLAEIHKRQFATQAGCRS